ncbi:MAG: metallophosphoesterase [Candidatus Solibacter sp.]
MPQLHKAALCLCVSLLSAATVEKPFRCAVIGDTGTGGRAQFEIAARLSDLHRASPIDSVLMLGDNLYGGQKAKDYRAKFELPYAQLLESGVPFYAVLGNHDAPGQERYAQFHMDGRRYYTLAPREGIRLFALDSSRFDAAQLAWLKEELGRSKEVWKIAFFHHPIYSSGARHGSDLALRSQLEPLFVKHGVSVVLSGHDHFYERLQAQQGVHYFVAGGSAKLRAGNVRRTAMTASAFDRDNSFLMLEIEKDEVRFRAISRSGQTVDEGSIPRGR